MELRPIVTDEDHAHALRAAERLWDAPPGSIESQTLDALATLIDAYERKRWPIAASDPIEIIQYAIDDLGRSQVDLGKIIGRTRASEILNRKRALTIEMIDKIEKAWGIPRQLLAVPYEIGRHKISTRLRRKVPKRKAATRKVAARKRA